ncbi:diaminopropionate ammonia-lyase [Lentibacillus halophilus]|uniref:Diaminopropionate ammonia-lyase n=1 Tax=Lentibacillus halophilus TaxID=295065 RepID=A0ABN0ZBJ6_9BACI
MERSNIQWVRNDHYNAEFNDNELAYFTETDIQDVLRFQRTHPSYTNTPLQRLPNLAQHLQISDIRVKDESYRFGLNAFKVMGGIYAIAKILAERLNRNVNDLSFAEWQSAEVREQMGNLTFITATDGNHGRGVAWAARELGQRAVVYMPKGSLPERLHAIRNEGAFAEITDKNYDDTVRMSAAMAEENDWVMVQDTAWEGYEDIPLWIMQGYAAIAQEIIDELNKEQDQAPTHVFLQAGVGSFAGAIAAYLQAHYGARAPQIIVVEPDQADCYYRSFVSGEMTAVTGDMDTIMAGLACGEPNNRAFPILRQYASASFSCSDSIAALGMRVLGNPLGDDPRIVAGESGAAPLGLVHYLRSFPETEACAAIGLDEQARVLVINTEGDTDQHHYRDIVWKGMYPVANQ